MMAVMGSSEPLHRQTRRPGANSGGRDTQRFNLHRKSPSYNNDFALGVFRNHPGYPTNRA
jgi:hypothetical protein